MCEIGMFDPGTKLIQIGSWCLSLELNPAHADGWKCERLRKDKRNDGDLGEENRHLCSSEWLRRLLTESRRLGQLISHARFQALDSNCSIRTLVHTHEEEAAVWLEFPLERKEGQPSRWEQGKRGGQGGNRHWEEAWDLVWHPLCALSSASATS